MQWKLHSDVNSSLLSNNSTTDFFNDREQNMKSDDDLYKKSAQLEKVYQQAKLTYEQKMKTQVHDKQAEQAKASSKTKFIDQKNLQSSERTIQPQIVRNLQGESGNMMTNSEKALEILASFVNYLFVDNGSKQNKIQ